MTFQVAELSFELVEELRPLVSRIRAVDRPRYLLTSFTRQAWGRWHDGGMRRRFSVKARLRSFVYAGRGLRTLLASQHNAWVHAAATGAAVGAGALVRLERLEWLALVVAIVLVWTAAVLICAVGALATAAFVFAPHL